jgi:hypothetical protein
MAGLGPLTKQYFKREGKDRAIPVTSRGGPEGCEMLGLPHFVDNQLRDGNETDSLRPFTPRKITGIHFHQRLSGTQDYVNCKIQWPHSDATNCTNM